MSDPAVDRIYEELRRLNEKIDTLSVNFGADTLPRLASLEQWKETHATEDSRAHERISVLEERLREMEQVKQLVELEKANTSNVLSRLDKAEKTLERWGVGVGALVLICGAAITMLVNLLFKGVKP